jgi:hypothetical protein
VSSIEGIPEGWELAKFGVPKSGEWVLDPNGEPLEANSDGVAVWPIIRKIERPKQYRAFASKAEAMLSWDAKVRRKADGSGIFRVVAIGETTIGIGFSLFSFQDAFNCYECNDGTPFGVEVTS